VKLTTHLNLVPRSNNEWSYTSTPQYAFMAWCHMITYHSSLNINLKHVENVKLKAIFVYLKSDAGCVKKIPEMNNMDLPSFDFTSS
jgi:hypothetical protein